MTRREARIFACVAETVVAPAHGLPPVAETDAVAYFGSVLATSPALNRRGLRVLLHALELAPLLVLRPPRRMSSLDPDMRRAYMANLGRGPAAPLVEALASIAKVAYYGEDGVMRSLGYDSEANVARGRALRVAEGRW